MHSQRLPRRLWPIVEAQAECATKVWRKPDQGIWEARGKPQHYVSSKLMCWVAMDRAAKLAAIRGDPDLEAEVGGPPPPRSTPTSSSTASTKDGVLRQHYDTDALDASTLLAAMFGFLPGEDERMHASVLAIADELTEHGFVLRYRTDETDDGLSGKEGTFLICSFWLVSALAIVGEVQRAHDLMERLLRVASPLGLYAEEFDADTGRHLGNFPQAFSHLALIEASSRIILAEQLALEGLGPPSSMALAAVDPDQALGVRDGPLRRDHDRHRRRRGDAGPPPRAVGQADPAARARRLAATRAAERLGRGGVRQRPLRDVRHVALRERRRRSSRRCTTSSAAPRSCTARRCTGCERRTSASFATTTGSRPRGRSPTTRWSRTTRWPSATTTCTAPAARTRPSRRPARRTRSRRSRTSRGSRSSPTTSGSSATIRSTRPAA